MLAKNIARALLVAGLLATLPAGAEAGALGKAVARGTAKGIAKALPRQKLGPVHKFKAPTPLERWTNRPKTDARRGLPPHSYWIRPEKGPKGSAAHIRKELRIPHPLKQRERLVAPPGTRYHDRPLRGGERDQREVIIHDRVKPGDLKLGERVKPGTAN